MLIKRNRIGASGFSAAGFFVGLFVFLSFSAGAVGARALPLSGDSIITARSLDGGTELKFWLKPGGVPTYSVSHRGRWVIKPSSLGFVLKDAPALEADFQLMRVDSSVHREEWFPVLGEDSVILDEHRAIRIQLQERGQLQRQLHIEFRIFSEGVGFRFHFPKQKNLDAFIILEEKTEFALSGDHQAFWIPGDYDTNEFTYNTTRLSEVDASKPGFTHNIHAMTFFARNAVQTPLQLKSVPDSVFTKPQKPLYINIHEAGLVNYPAMQLLIDARQHKLQCTLVPDALGNKAYLQTPDPTPWRVIIASETAIGILNSRMILNLNEPSRIKNTEFIKPMKYVGIWWEMHVGKSTWDYAATQVAGEKLAQSRHGATTKRTKEYIDFAARHGFQGVLVEGWNTGWEDWFGKWKEEVFDFVTPYPDYDILELSRYAKSKGVELIMHHETSGSVTNYERRMDTAFRFMKQFGISGVKTGYVGKIIPRGEHHDGQWMVNHFTRVAAKAAEYGIMVNSHESVRPTGIHRTYPNYISAEAARGMEYNAWSSGNPPEHETILPFTRLMGGPMDYTPGIFRIKLDYWQPGKKEQIQTTLAKQLALYVTLYSPLQMAADLPEVYEQRLDAFQFIKDVPADWAKTKVLLAEPGEYLAMARKQKNGGEWFIGVITDERSRELSFPLDFLEPGKTYEMIQYLDGDQAHWKDNPEQYKILKSKIKAGSLVKLKLAAGGGAAIHLRPL